MEGSRRARKIEGPTEIELKKIKISREKDLQRKTVKQRKTDRRSE